MTDQTSPKPDTNSGENTDSDVGIQMPSTAESDPLDGARDAAESRPGYRMGGTPVFLGGIGAAVAGFILAEVVPAGWPLHVVDERTTVISQTQDELRGNLVDLGAKVDAIDVESAVAEGRATTDLMINDAAAQSAQAREEIAASFAGFETRLSELEKRPIAGDAASEAAVESYQRDVLALRQQLEDQRAEIEAMLATTAERAGAAEQGEVVAIQQVALVKLMGAVESGAPYMDELNDLGAHTKTEMPATLTDHAETGVPSLGALQEEFPPAARAALDAVTREGVENGTVSRVDAFFRTQLGARSVTPRDGQSADAILSRAEQALRQGQIDIALTELATLPSIGRDAMQNWTLRATIRKAALAALADITISSDEN